MAAFCPYCGTERTAGMPYCAACGARLDEPARKKSRRRGGYAVTGLLLALLGGAWLFVPFWPSSMGKLSLWQSHDVCSSLLGTLAPSECSQITLFWAFGLGLIGLGAITLLGAALRAQPSDPPARPHDRSAAVQQVKPAPPAPEATDAPPMPIAAPADPVPPTQRTTRGDARPLVGAGVLGLLVVVGVVLAANLGGSTTRTVIATPAPTSVVGRVDPDLPAIAAGTAPVTVDVPIIACATTYGSGEIQEPQPASEAMTLPESLAGRVALFATNYDRVLAPREFRCTADVGANGTAVLTVTSPDQSAAVIAENGAASFSYVLELACPLFPEAATLAKQQFDQDCPQPPADEVVTLDRPIAYFEDPPGVAGTGTQSGGSLGAIGAIAFAGGDAPGAIKITCVLPDEERAICEFVVSNWVSSFRTVQ